MQTQTETTKSSRVSNRQLMISALVDRLGEVKARRAEAETEEKRIVEELKEHGAGVYSGDLFDANVFDSTSSKLDKAKLLKKHAKMAQWLEQCTTTTATLVCKVTARLAR